MQRRSVWEGAFWLSLGSMASKVIGAGYRIFLPRLLGDYGVGLFQMAYPLYSVLLAISVNGIPTALSKQTAELYAADDEVGADHLVAWALVCLAVLGTTMAIGMALLAPWLALHIFSDEKASATILALSPALAFVSLEAGFRGGFQGRQEMLPTAFSQVIEQLARVAVMFWLAIHLIAQGIPQAAAGATLGAPAGALLGAIYLAIHRWRQRPRLRITMPPPWKGLIRLGAVAAPMSLAGLLFPLMLLVDSIFVPDRLRMTGMTIHQATSQFGLLSGEAMPLINLTMVVAAALAISLVPAVAEYVRAERRQEAARRVESAMHAVWLLGLPMSAGLYLLARPIVLLLYGQAGATQALEVLALGSSILAMQQVLGGALQAAGHGWIPVKNLVIGTALKFALTWWMTPVLGIRGAAIATVLSSALTAYLNWRDWCQVIAVPTRPWRHLRWPIIGSVVMALAVLTWREQAQNWNLVSHTAIAILIGCFAYAAVIAVSGERDAFSRLWRRG